MYIISHHTMLFSLLLEMLLKQKVEKIDKLLNGKFKSLFSDRILILYGSATCLPATENCWDGMLYSNIWMDFATCLPATQNCLPATENCSFSSSAA